MPFRPKRIVDCGTSRSTTCGVRRPRPTTSATGCELRLRPAGRRRRGRAARPSGAASMAPTTAIFEVCRASASPRCMADEVVARDRRRASRACRAPAGRRDGSGRRLRARRGSPAHRGPWPRAAAPADSWARTRSTASASKRGSSEREPQQLDGRIERASQRLGSRPVTRSRSAAEGDLDRLVVERAMEAVGVVGARRPRRAGSPSWRRCRPCRRDPARRRPGRRSRWRPAEPHSPRPARPRCRPASGPSARAAARDSGLGTAVMGCHRSIPDGHRERGSGRAAGSASVQQEPGDGAALDQPGRARRRARPRRVTASMSLGPARHVLDRQPGRQRGAVPARQRGLVVLRIDGVGDEPRLGPLQIVGVDDRRSRPSGSRRRSASSSASSVTSGGRHGPDVEARVVERRAHVVGAGRRPRSSVEHERLVEQAGRAAAEMMRQHFERRRLAGPPVR